MSFSVSQKVLFKHCDPAGIVFYPRYFEMINDCIEAFFDHIGHPFEDLHRQAAVPTAQIETVFTAPSRHGDHLEIMLTVERLGGSSLDLALHANCGDETRFTTKSTLVYINSNGRPQKWSAPLRQALASHLSE